MVSQECIYRLLWLYFDTKSNSTAIYGYYYTCKVNENIVTEVGLVVVGPFHDFVRFQFWFRRNVFIFFFGYISIQKVILQEYMATIILGKSIRTL